MSLFSHKIKESQHKLVARLVREVGARLRCTQTRRSDVSIETWANTHRYLVGNAHIEDGEDVGYHAGFE